jgi:hypothetical protein
MMPRLNRLPNGIDGMRLRLLRYRGRHNPRLVQTTVEIRRRIHPRPAVRQARMHCRWMAWNVMVVVVGRNGIRLVRR